MTISKLRNQRILFVLAALIALIGFLHLLEHFALCEKSTNSCELCHFMLAVAEALPIVLLGLLPVLIGRTAQSQTGYPARPHVRSTSPRAPPFV